MAEKVLKIQIGSTPIPVWDSKINDLLTEKGDLLVTTANKVDGEAQLGKLSVPSETTTKILSIENGTMQWSDPGIAAGVNDGEFRINETKVWSANSANNYDLIVKSGDNFGQINVANVTVNVTGIGGVIDAITKTTLTSSDTNLPTDSAVKSYVNGRIGSEIPSTVTVATAIESAIDNATGLGDITPTVTVKGYVDSTVSNALTSAKSYTDESINTLTANLGTASTKDYADSVTETGDLPTSSAVVAYVNNKISSLGILKLKGVKENPTIIQNLDTGDVGDVWIASSDSSEWVCTEQISGVAKPSAWEKFGTITVEKVAYIGDNTVADSNFTVYDNTNGKLKDGGVVGAFAHVSSATGTTTIYKYTIDNDITGSNQVVSGLNESTATTTISAISSTLNYLSAVGLTVNSDGVLSLQPTQATVSPSTVSVTINTYSPTYKYFHESEQTASITVE